MDASFNKETFFSYIQDGTKQANKVTGRKALIVVGNTGAGKSTFINYLEGCQLEAGDEGTFRVSATSAVPEVAPIGHGNQSATRLPIAIEATDLTLGSGCAIIDCPGFYDNRGAELRIANAVNIRQCVLAASVFIVVVLVHHASLDSDRGRGITEICKVLFQMFGSVENFTDNSKSVMLGITHAPVRDPRRGTPFSLSSFQRKLGDKSGLPTVMTPLVDVLAERCFVYDPEDMGDDTWLRRGSLINGLQQLVPIAGASAFFRSALTDGDILELNKIM